MNKDLRLSFGLVLGLMVFCPAGYAVEADALREALTSAPRADADKARDAGRKPAQVLTFLGVERGMTVFDLIAASGYYTETLSVAVGPTGQVYAQNPAAVLRGDSPEVLTAPGPRRRRKYSLPGARN